nr:immunoglobulin heavy chain junction region [Macaca mulatta]MOW94840.1 immunoglobulin heavy chain junction region [Macaca mulatta]MOW95551.1 immunoglobulin heavy chain junction region [Macaca mulatta]MOW96062.1 immunoglobulin heavy chain junction region [Macaca mulatta]MOW96107.1 immunoglobulin heavy chain junction region [Macaca mulatta]
CARYALYGNNYKQESANRFDVW